jgi:hypothetical protein
MIPKIGDFGLSRLFSTTGTCTTTTPLGTMWVHIWLKQSTSYMILLQSRWFDTMQRIHTTRVRRQTRNLTKIWCIQFGCCYNTYNGRTQALLWSCW